MCNAISVADCKEADCKDKARYAEDHDVLSLQLMSLLLAVLIAQDVHNVNVCAISTAPVLC